MVRQGWGAILSSLGCAHSPAPQTHHAVFPNTHWANRITRLFLSGSTCRDESECDWMYHRINTYIQCICRTKKKMNATPVLLNLNQKLLYLFLKEDFSFFLSSYLNMT